MRPSQSHAHQTARAHKRHTISKRKGSRRVFDLEPRLAPWPVPSIPLTNLTKTTGQLRHSWIVATSLTSLPNPSLPSKPHQLGFVTTLLFCTLSSKSGTFWIAVALVLGLKRLVQPRTRSILSTILSCYLPCYTELNTYLIPHRIPTSFPLLPCLVLPCPALPCPAQCPTWSSLNA